MDLLPQELTKILPPLYSQESTIVPIVHAKLFTPDAGWTGTSRKALRKRTKIGFYSDMVRRGRFTSLRVRRTISCSRSPVITNAVKSAFSEGTYRLCPCTFLSTDCFPLHCSFSHEVVSHSFSPWHSRPGQPDHR